MRAYFDTEHVKIYSTPLTLASIGIIRDDGESLYMVSADFKRSKAGSWFKKNVWPHLEPEDKFPFDEIARTVQLFLTPVTQMVTRNGDNDFQLLKNMLGWLPFMPVDIEKIWRGLGEPPLQKHQGRHHALDDAIYHRELFTQLQGMLA